MEVQKYSIELFDSLKNARYVVTLFANSMSAAAYNAKRSLVNSGVSNSENVCIRKIYTVA
nr:MAG TPA: hypothetical protein [Caudoviricetes sp.]